MPNKPPALMTIGYEGTVLNAVLTALQNAGVTHVLDVRAVPQSRKPGFSKRLLAASLEALGIRYTHLRDLGTPKAGRDAVRHGDVPAMHRIFHAHMTGDGAQAALAHATSIAAAEPACLLCFERDHRCCHRDILAGMIHSRSGQQIQHLTATNPNG